jgi:hypothetical protein
MFLVLGHFFLDKYTDLRVIEKEEKESTILPTLHTS